MLSLRGTGTPAAAAESGSPRHGHSCLCLLSTSTDSRDGPRPRRSWRGGQRSFTRSHTGLWTPPCPVELYILQRSVEMWLPVFTPPSPKPLLLTHPTAFAWLAQRLLSLLHLTIVRLYTCPSLIKRFLEGRAWSYSSLISQSDTVPYT